MGASDTTFSAGYSVLVQRRCAGRLTPLTLPARFGRKNIFLFSNNLPLSVFVSRFEWGGLHKNKSLFVRDDEVDEVLALLPRRGFGLTGNQPFTGTARPAIDTGRAAERCPPCLPCRHHGHAADWTPSRPSFFAPRPGRPGPDGPRSNYLDAQRASGAKSRPVTDE